MDFKKKTKLLFIVIILTITILSIHQVKAYYATNVEKNINLATQAFENITLSLDKTIYGSCNELTYVNLRIENLNDYQIFYEIHFDNNDPIYLIDDLPMATYNLNAFSSKNHTIEINGETGTQIVLTVKVTLPYSKTYTKTINFDNACPTGVIASTNNMATSQTATLTMTDNKGVTSYYWGTSSSPATSDYTSITSTTSTSVTKTVNDAGTYYLFVKDASENIYNTSADYYQISFTSKTGKVEPLTIVAKSGNTINLPTPTGGSSNYVFKEWNTAADGSGTSYKNTFITTGSDIINLYAIWSCDFLYCVLESEATSGSGLAQKYTGAHQDSYSKTGTNNIYHWYANSDANGTTILNKNNVIFAGFCWQMIRTTDTGGVKMIYNGEVVDGKCLNSRSTHAGFNSRTTQTLSSNYYYGTSYTYDASAGTFTLAGTLIQATWSNDTANNLIGLYTCKSSSATGTCTTLYYVESKNSNTSAYVLPLQAGTHYSAIGNVQFNASSNSPAYAGYMYNIVYPYESTSFTESTLMFSSFSLSTNYYYASDVVWNTTTSRYNLVSPYKVSDTSEYANLVGKYTFMNSSETYANPFVYYIDHVNDRYMYLISLSWGKTLSDADRTYVFGDDIADNGDGTYTLTNPTSVKRSEWYENYASYNNKYTCNGSAITCAEPLYTITTSTANFIYINTVTKNFKYASSYYYEDGKYYLTGEQQTFWDWSSNYNKINNTRYTCFNATGVCETISYIYLTTSNSAYHINIAGGKSVSDALVEMLSADNVNATNSTIKSAIDAWYKQNMLSYTSYLEDTIFYNNRSIRSLGGWNPNGGSSSLDFNYKVVLDCTNETDKFSVSNPKAKLTYPVGLASYPEMELLGNNILRNTGVYYWLSSPAYLGQHSPYMILVESWGSLANNGVQSSYGVRPVISLKSGTSYSSGNGSMENPYIIDLN